jgi:hypothetical protein
MKKHSLVLLVAVLLTSPLFAGVVFEVETKDHDASSTNLTNVAAQGHLLKMGIAKGRGDSEMIFRGDRKEMVIVDHGEKSYLVMDQETMQKLAGTINDAMKQMEEALKNVPEGQRAMIEKMMKDRMPAQVAAPKGPLVEVRKSGERADHSGYPCVRYDMLRDGRKVRELWVTDWDNVEGGEEVAATFAEMAEFFKEMLDSLSSASGLGAGFADQITDNAFAHMKEIGGFPVVTRELDDDGSLESESTLRSAKRQTLDPAAFEPPAGYKRQNMFPGR